MGKTRLSREFRYLVAPKTDDDEDVDQTPLARKKILYYNAFTEDLLYWDNDLAGDVDLKMKIQPNSFTRWVLEDQGQDQNITSTFQRYANEKLTPRFNEEYLVRDENGKEFIVKAFSEVTFSLQRGDDEYTGNLKISKSEESIFIWSIFYSMIEQVVDVLNVLEPNDRETDQFDQLEYVFIDDPVTSLDENHLIELAVNLAKLIKSSQSELKFIVSTHSPLFYNVLFNELGLKKKSERCYMLVKHEDGTFDLNEKRGDSNQSFSYHLYIKQLIEQAIEQNEVQRYHFVLLRNLYEKAASFLGYPRWSDLLPEDNRQGYATRVMNFYSHKTLSNEEISEPTEPEKQTVKRLLENLKNNYGFWQQEQQNA